jgi:hypothetical protein
MSTPTDADFTPGAAEREVIFPFFSFSAPIPEGVCGLIAPEHG